MGEVTTIVPVIKTQVGCVKVANGAAGAFGTALITKSADEIHDGSPAVSRTLMV